MFGNVKSRSGEEKDKKVTIKEFNFEGLEGRISQGRHSKSRVAASIASGMTGTSAAKAGSADVVRPVGRRSREEDCNMCCRQANLTANRDCPLGAVLTTKGFVLVAGRRPKVSSP